MNDTPGRMLSSFRGGDKKHPKLGGCVGVFLQLFDLNRRFNGKRFFSHQLLPAERPKQSSKRFTVEKLPMAKLLLIADENRGGFPNSKRNSSSNSESLGDNSHVKESNIRSPGVVARLMGLESMPTPESQGDRKETAHCKKALVACPPQDLLHKTHDLEAEDAEKRKQQELKRRPVKKKLNKFEGKSTEAFSASTKMESSNKVSAKRPFARNQSDVFHQTVSNGPKASGTLVRHAPRAVADRLDDPSAVLLSKLSPLSTHPTGSPLKSILSPSKNHNKLASPTKSPLTTKSRVRLFEAAAKILEPKMQPSNRPHNPSIRFPVARSLLKDPDAEDKSGKNAAHTSHISRKGQSNLVNALKDQQLSKSWNGPSSEHSTQRDAATMQVRGKQHSEQHVSSRRCSAISSDQPDCSRYQKSHQRSEHPKNGGFSGRQEKQPSIPGDAKYEDQQEGTVQCACPQVYRARAQQNPAPGVHLCQETLWSSSSVRDAGLQRLRRSGSEKEDSVVARLAHSDQGLIHERTSGNEDKDKLELCQHASVTHTKQDPVAAIRLRQTKSLNQQSQDAGNTINGKKSHAKKASIKRDRDTSSPRGSRIFQSDSTIVVPEGSFDSPGPTQSTCDLSSQSFYKDSTITRGSSGGIFSYSKLFSSRKNAKASGKEKGESKKIETMKKKVDSLLMRSLLRRTTNNEGEASAEKYSLKESKPKRSSLRLTDCKEITAYDLGFSNNTECNRFSKMSDQNVVFEEVLLQGDTAVSEFSISAFEKDNQEEESRETETQKSLWRQRNSTAHRGISSGTERIITEATSRSSKVVPADYSSQSSCESPSGDLKNTASSVYPELARRRKESLSLTGRTTAAILQELLMALNVSESNYPAKESSDGVDLFSLESDNCSNRLRNLSVSISGDQSASRGQILSELATTKYDILVQDNQVAVTSVVQETFTAGGIFVEESDFVSNSVCTDECGQPSPISILESPFEDESSISSDNFESIRETREELGVETISDIGLSQTDGEVASGSGPSQTDKLLITRQVEASNIVSNAGSVETNDSIGWAIDSQLKIRDEKQYVREIICAANLMSGNPPPFQLEESEVSAIDPALFDKLEEQVKEWVCWGASTGDGDGDYYGSMEEAAARSYRKLVFDCVNEWANSRLNRRKEGWAMSLLDDASSCSSRVAAASGVVVVRRGLGVWEQIEEWRDMARGKMIDDLVEKEMMMSSNAGGSQWTHFGCEIEDCCLELEAGILAVLIQELVGEFSSFPAKCSRF